MKKIEPDARQIRKLIRGKQPEIARQMGIAVSSLSRKINGSQRIYLDEINQLAEILQIEPLELLRQIVD